MWLWVLCVLAASGAGGAGAAVSYLETEDFISDLDKPGEHHSTSLARSTHSTSSLVARKLAAEAIHARRLLELERKAAEREAVRERLAAEREREVAEAELRAELAAIDAGSAHSGSVHRESVHTSRTTDWVNESDPVQVIDNNNYATHIVMPRAVADEKISLKKPTTSSPSLHAPCIPTRSSPENLCTSNVDKGKRSDIADLAAAITALAVKSSSDSRPIRKPWYVELPPYYGHPTQWLTFKRSFDDTKDSYSETENLARLRHAVRGDAHDAVASLLVSARESEEVLHALEQRFARPEYIVMQELATMRALPKLNENKDINTFACRIRNCVETIRLLNKDEYLHSPELFDAMVNKLSPWMQARWRDYAFGKQNQVKLILFSEFLLREAESQVKFGPLTLPQLPPLDYVTKREQRREKGQVHFTSTDSDQEDYLTLESTQVCAGLRDNVTEPTECSYCKGSHFINLCEKFKSLGVDDRWSWLRKSKVCYRCLKDTAHQWKSCKVKPCGINDCKLRHNRLLHGGTFPVAKPEQHSSTISRACFIYNPSQIEGTSILTSTGENRSTGDVKHDENNKAVVSNTFVEPFSEQKPPRHVLLKVLPVVVSGPTGEVETYAFIDEGATVSLIDSDVARRIGACGPATDLMISAIKGMAMKTTAEQVNFYIRGTKSNQLYLVENAKSTPSLGLTRQSVKSLDLSHYTHLWDLVDELSYEDAVPTVLIGSPDSLLTLSKETRSATKNEPVACLTALGWVLHGVHNSWSKPVQFVNTTAEKVHFLVETESEDIDSIIKEQYKLDCIGITKYNSVGLENNRALQILDTTSRRLSGGRFEVGLLWRSDNPQLPESYSQARRRLEMLEKKLAKSPLLMDLYNKNMQSMLDKGYAEECTGELSTNPLWYLPHFGVVNPNKPGKLRIVHDAASKSHGTSLNSSLLPGPDMLQSLLGILFRFRERSIAMTADIQEMFPQIKIRAEDRDAQRYLWRQGNTKGEVKEYRMSSMIFGATSSPCTAHYIRNKNAIEFEHTYPDATRAILHDHYMDDYIGSVDHVDQAAQLASDIITVHQQAGFVMRGWASNNPSVIESIPAELRHASSQDVELCALPTSIRTLGLIWNPSQDSLGFQTASQSDIPNTLTKRKVLSHLMRVYDPLGLLGVMVVRGRILFQLTWKNGLGWDDSFTPNEDEKWRTWLNDLSSVANLKLSRWYLGKSGYVGCELHIFSDASELAYAAVAYWRFSFFDGTVKLALVGSKARVTPLKPTTIPRLELQGALVAARLSSTICEEHERKPTKCYYWTDSMTVLGWLRNDARTFKAFVGHRIGEILETSNVSDWRWIPSALNVADDATRYKPGPLNLNDRWFVGPEFLLGSPETWPTEPSNLEVKTDYEEKRSKPLDVYCTTTVQPLRAPVSADAARFSNWMRLIRATAYAHKYIRELKERVFAKRSNSSPHGITHPLSLSSSRRASTSIKLTADDLRAAESHVLRRCQAESFSEEIDCIQAEKPITKGRLANLSLVLDGQGLLRLSGRIKAARGINDDVKNPIMLDGKQHSTRLLVQQMHQDYAHANNETVINEIRQKYWIIRVRDTVRTVSRKCQVCKNRRATPLNPPMGDLPFDRLAHHQRAFTFTGLDYFGPVEVSMFRRRLKRWVALFTCMTTRAIHLEIVENLTSDSAIMSLRRFIARRGKPSKILSDNATTFVGAKNQLADLYGEAVTNFVANKGIEWSFIPPSAPFMGGAWERLVRSVKTALLVTLHERAPKEEVLHTLLLEAEAIVNSRPLTHISIDESDPEALTPFHFILGTSSPATVHLQLEDADLVRRCDYKKALRLADHFWSRWIKEYLPTLLPRRVSGRPSESISIGDLVLIVDGNLPRGLWPRGRVTAVYPGQDGFVRVADVRTSGGSFRRPTKKLVRLPVDPHHTM